MPRTARLIYPDIPHHVTQRGNRRAPIFFRSGDERAYLRLLAEHTRRHGVEVWAYCLMPNHVHLILTPSDETGLARALSEAHRRYAALVNSREGWTGHLFQDRFASVAMDEAHLIAAARYVAMNPVKAGLVDRAQDWPWSSVHAHLSGKDGRLVRVMPLLERISDFAEFITADEERDRRYATAIATLELAEKLGRQRVGQVQASHRSALAASASAEGRQYQSPMR